MRCELSETPTDVLTCPPYMRPQDLAHPPTSPPLCWSCLQRTVSNVASARHSAMVFFLPKHHWSTLASCKNNHDNRQGIGILQTEPDGTFVQALAHHASGMRNNSSPVDLHGTQCRHNASPTRRAALTASPKTLAMQQWRPSVSPRHFGRTAMHRIVAARGLADDNAK